jgi:hypothetical protein
MTTSCGEEEEVVLVVDTRYSTSVARLLQILRPAYIFVARDIIITGSSAELRQHLLAGVGLIDCPRDAVHEPRIVIYAVKGVPAVGIIGIGARVHEGRCVARTVCH